MSKGNGEKERNISRRGFLTAATLGAGYGAYVIMTGCRGGFDFDLLIEGGTLYDGLGNAAVNMDIGIKDGRILAIGKLGGRSARRIVNAAGLAVAPGFIDIHSHSDDDLLVDGRAESKVRQGVTTEVIGQDGGSMAPLTPAMRDKMDESFRERYDIRVDWLDFAGYFKRLRQAGISVNITSMIGAGTLREHVVGFDDRPATRDELAQMQTLVQNALRQGARHLSSGLEYTPGSFASADELAQIASLLGSTGLYATHIRNEDDRLLEAVAEAIDIARRGGVRLNISHLKASGARNWPKLPTVLASLDEARASGLFVTCDRYPYVAYSTSLTSLFPLWSREGGGDRFIERLQNPAELPKIREGVIGKVNMLGNWDAVMITSLPGEKHKAYEGRRLGELSRELGAEPFTFLKDLLIEEHGRGGMVGFAMSEENTAKVLAYRYCAIASDGSALATTGPLAAGNPHPRNFGTFPRLLGYYAREQKIMPLEEAIRKITSLPAEIVGIADRGRLAENMRADVVVFDPEKLADTATFNQPAQYPAGMAHVVVNGEIVLDGSEHTGARPGVIL